MDLIKFSGGLTADKEKERRILLQETKKDLWKRWRQKKGRGMRDPAKIGEKENLEKKLSRVEAEVIKYQEELEKMEAVMRERREVRTVGGSELGGGDEHLGSLYWT